ncbi:hypothetical protein G6514_006720 [Epicoccum nigrum]|nr:hypothetical protein G6514_006720 [Epicoccum nigrum]
MPAPIVTYAVVQAASATVSAAINTYLNAPPRPSFHADNGQETLYDEENWARVLDIQEILCLVQPFIDAVQNLDLEQITRATTPELRGQGRRLDEQTADAPPPYDVTSLPADPEAFLKEQSYLIIRTTKRLMETLQVASGGPSASSGRAWNMHVMVSVETGLDVLQLYRQTTRTMSNSPPGSLLYEYLMAMGLYDTDLLRRVGDLFRPVKLHLPDGHTLPLSYQLRLPAAKRYLDIGSAKKSDGGGSNGWKTFAVATGILVAGSLIGGAAYSGYKTYRYFTESSPLGASESCSISKAGACGARISFVPVAIPHKAGDKSCEEKDVRFGMQVHVVASARQLKDKQIATVRIVHPEERYRSQSLGRSIRVRDRIMLQEEGTGTLLSRKKVSDDDWEVDFGLSDDTLWTILMPM